jgi:hypothetical protein
MKRASVFTKGIGGEGKTALTTAAAYHRLIQNHFSDGILWASMGPEGDPVVALLRWAEGLGIYWQGFSDPDELRKAVQHRLSKRRMLLVLDDIWQRDQVEYLRCGGRNCAHLLSTRDERIATFFAGHASHVLEVGNLAKEAACNLLETIAPDTCSLDRAAAQRMVRWVNRLPLAVVMLGGYLARGSQTYHERFPDKYRQRKFDMEGATKRLVEAQKGISNRFETRVTVSSVLERCLKGFSTEETASY